MDPGWCGWWRTCSQFLPETGQAQLQVLHEKRDRMGLKNRVTAEFLSQEAAPRSATHHQGGAAVELCLGGAQSSHGLSSCPFLPTCPWPMLLRKLQTFCAQGAERWGPGRRRGPKKLGGVGSLSLWQSMATLVAGQVLSSRTS